LAKGVPQIKELSKPLIFNGLNPMRGNILSEEILGKKNETRKFSAKITRVFIAYLD